MRSSSGAKPRLQRPKIGLSSGQTVSPAQARRRGLKPLRAEHGRLVSPESYFLRTGKIPKGIRKRRTKKLTERFLNRSWHEGLKGKKNRALPLPSFKERLNGKKLSGNGIAEMKRQTAFILEKFAKHLSEAERLEADKKIGKLLTKRTISVSAWLRQEGNSIDLEQLRKYAKIFYGQYGKAQRQFYGFISADDRIFLARGFADYARSATTPVHEIVHALQRIGVIKVDVPFAQASDRLRALERGIIKADPRMREPTAEEFDRKPRYFKENGTYNEPGWSYPVGDRIGQWVYQNLPRKKRWAYLYQRCMGESHFDALKKIR